MNKMILAIVPRDQAEPVLNALIAAGYTATFSDSRGGVLRQAQQMLFIAVAEEELAKVLAIIRDRCRSKAAVEVSQSGNVRSVGAIPVTAGRGGAIIFVWDLDHFAIY